MNRWLISSALFAVGAATLVGCDSKDPNSKDPTPPPPPPPNTTSSSGGAPPVEQPPKTPKEVPVTPKDGDDVAVLDTAMGKIVVMFYPDKAPRHVENFINLAKKGFYNGTRFHRCIPGFMIQGGDPLSKDLSRASLWGTGGNKGTDGKEINVPSEFNDVHHGVGVLSMARGGDPNSASSQFFIMVGDNSSLDGQYSAFGHVVSGQEIAEKIVQTGADAGQSGQVTPPEKAVVLKTVTVTKWPIK